MEKNEVSNQELLQYAIEKGIINEAYLQEQIAMQKRKELLEKHPYEIWQGKNSSWYTYLPDKEKGRILKKRTTKKGIEDIVIEYWKEQIENPTISEVFTEWNDRRVELKKISQATWLRNKQIFNRHYVDFGKRRIRHIDSIEVVSFLEEQIPLYDLSAKSFSNLKTITRGIFKYAKRMKYVPFQIEEIFYELDVSDVSFKKVIKEDYEEVFDEDEMSKITEYLIENPDAKNLAILLMFVTGIRIGEAVALKHIDFSKQSVDIRRTETRYLNDQGKYVYEVKEYPKTGAGVRTAVVPNEYLWLIERIKLQNPFGEYVFCNQCGEKCTTPAVRMRLRRICVKLNIFHKSPHKIRKTYGTILLDNNVDKRLIIEQMGHTDITCTENHYHRNRRKLTQKAEILSHIQDFQVKVQ